MLLYGSYMRGVGLKWRRLFFWYTLSCFDPYQELEKVTITQMDLIKEKDYI